MKSAVAFALAIVVSSLSAQAQTATSRDEHTSHHAPAASSGAQTGMADGEVRKIDKEQAKITLRHGPIAKLDMPGMTMVFKVADPKMLDAVKQGDKVRFDVEKVNGAVVVTAIEPGGK